MTQKILFGTLAVLALATAWYFQDRPLPKEVCVVFDDGTWSRSRPMVVPRFWFTQLDV
jgi:hypothetical protein